MRNIYEKNLAYLKKLSIEYYNRVINTQNDSVTIFKCKNGKKSIAKYINGKRISVHSNYDPIEQAKVIKNKAFDQESDIILIFGMGLGYELKEMLKENREKRYFIIEPDVEIFKAMIKNFDLKSIFNEKYNLNFIFEDNADKINAEFLSIIGERKTTSIKFITLPFYENVYKELIDKTFKLIQHSIMTVRSNLATNLAADRQWVLNYGRNMQYIYETLPVNKLKKYFNNVPAIIVGAGPSINYNLEYLKKIKDKALIVGAGNGTMVLDKNNIKCNMVGAMDGNEITDTIYNDLNINNESVLFYSSQVFSTVPSHIHGKKFLMNQVLMDLYINEKLDTDTKGCFSGPSITNVLANTLSDLGCNPIIFLGQDLCIRDGQAYSKDTIHKQEKDVTGLIKTKNKIGEDVYTEEQYLLMKNSMENVIQRHPNNKYLNGTKYGLHIKGAEDIDFNEYAANILLNQRKYDFDDIFEKCFKENFNDEYKNKLDKFLVNLYNEVKNLFSVFKKIICLIDGKEGMNVKVKNTSELEKELEEHKIYTNVFKPTFELDLNLIFKSKDNILENKKQKYLYYADKCNVLIDGLEAVYNFS